MLIVFQIVLFFSIIFEVKQGVHTRRKIRKRIPQLGQEFVSIMLSQYFVQSIEMSVAEFFIFEKVAITQLHSRVGNNGKPYLDIDRHQQQNIEIQK